MNLDKLFQAQKELREHINYNGEDRFEKLVLALLVEIGECANEWRGFKFWSKDQSPNELTYDDYADAWYDKKGKMYSEYKNHLLEEYVDGLHFVLELGIEKDMPVQHWVPKKAKRESVNTQFIFINALIVDFWEREEQLEYWAVLGYYLGLGEMLGFTDEQVEDAYFAKNQINHSRQENGY